MEVAIRRLPEPVWALWRCLPCALMGAYRGVQSRSVGIASGANIRISAMLIGLPAFAQYVWQDGPPRYAAMLATAQGCPPSM